MFNRFVGLTGNIFSDDFSFDDNFNANKFAKPEESEGNIIPVVFGRARVKGRILIANVTPKILQDPEAKESSVALIVVGICKGPVTSINGIYVNGEKNNFSQDECFIYLGTCNQEVDPTIARHFGAEMTAFRGLAYAVFPEFSLENFQGKIPQFSFDVSALYEGNKDRISKITAVNIIPGCGEFVYDTRLLRKKHLKKDEGEEVELDQDDELLFEFINYEKNAKESNSIINVKFLKRELPKVKWVAPVICWFGNSIDIAECKISPRTEYAEGIAVVLDENNQKIEWKVAHFTRASADVVGFDGSQMRYGGTISDESVLRYLKMLKANGYKVMFYPMIFLDIKGKPWRGYMKGNASQVENFFRRLGGYNEFILHYANLVKDYVDAFVIGSELEQITKIYSLVGGNREFPAAAELSNLAIETKRIFAGRNIKITYAANWSEYHSYEGWYHLDKLWMCDAIDFIGIDAYFPATNTHDSDITHAQILNGYTSGECYDYYYDAGFRHRCEEKYALKNVEYWWSQKHVNPNGKESAWIPKAKKIWFTEFGFASVDKTTNEPNVFCDASSQDGGLPRLSSGDLDFAIQEEAISAFIDHFRSLSCIEEMFLWCWDARYPAWPNQEIWKDSDNWPKGHWVNGKLSGVCVSEVLRAIFSKSDFDLENLEIDPNIKGLMSGFVIQYDCSFANILEILRLRYGFDLYYKSNGTLSIVSRENLGKGNKNLQKVSFENLIQPSHKKSITFLHKKSGVQDIRMDFLLESLQTQPLLEIATGAKVNSKLKFPVVTSLARANSIAHNILQGIREKECFITLCVPFYFDILPTQQIELTTKQGKTMPARVVSVNWHLGEKEIICVSLFW